MTLGALAADRSKRQSGGDHKTRANLSPLRRVRRQAERRQQFLSCEALNPVTASPP